MKNIVLLFLLMIICIIAKSQTYGVWMKPNNSVGTIMNGISGDSALAGPTGCGDPTTTIGINKYTKKIKKVNYYFDSCNHRLWYYDPKQYAWDTIKSGGGSSQQTLQQVFDKELGHALLTIADTMDINNHTYMISNGATPALTITGNNSAASFNTSSSSAPNSFSWGSNNSASGQMATSFGQNTHAKAPWSTAFGNNAEVSVNATGATAWGNNTYATQSYQTAFGRWNDTTRADLFTVGAGWNNTSRKNALSVDTAANIYTPLLTTSNLPTLQIDVVDSTNGKHYKKDIPSSGGATGLNARDSLNWYLGADWGIVANGSTDNVTAIRAIRDDIARRAAAGLYIPPFFLGSGNIYMSDSVYFYTKGTKIFGNGSSTNIKLNTAKIAFYILDSSEVSGMNAHGTNGAGTIPGGVFTTQGLVRITGSGNKVHDLTGDQIDGSLVMAYANSGTIYANEIYNIIARYCTIAVDLPINCEDTHITNVQAFNCNTAFRERSSGNNTWDLITGIDGITGFSGEGGGNGDHSTISNFRFNHNSTANINIKSTANGYIFGPGYSYSGNILLGSSGTAKNVTFSHVFMGGVMTITSTSTFGNTVAFKNCMYALDATVTKSLSDTVDFINNQGAPIVDPSEPRYWRTDDSTARFATSVTTAIAYGGTTPVSSFIVKGTSNGSPTAATTGFGVYNGATRVLDIWNDAHMGLNTPPLSNVFWRWRTNGASNGTYAAFCNNGNGDQIVNIDEQGDWEIGDATTNTNKNKIYGKTFLGGGTTPTSYAHIAAGTTTIAPLGIENGVTLTSMTANKFEYQSPQLFFTNAGAQRQEIPQIQQTRVSTQFDKTSSTALANVTGLTATLVAGKTYRFEADLYTTSNVAGGVQFAIAGTATATAIVYEGLTHNAGVITQSRGTALAAAVGAVTAVTAAYFHVSGTITVNAAGTLTIQFAQNASTGTASSVLVGSTFITTEML